MTDSIVNVSIEFIVFVAVGLGLLAYALFLIFTPAHPGGKRGDMATAAPPAAGPIVLRDFKEADLAAFDGNDGKPICLAADGYVFDVSRGRMFYGPGGWYSCFSGRDASIGLATAETDVSKWTRKSVSELTAAERDVLGDWVMKFQGKYDVVGFLNDGAHPRTLAEEQAKSKGI